MKNKHSYDIEELKQEIPELESEQDLLEMQLLLQEVSDLEEHEPPPALKSMVRQELHRLQLEDQEKKNPILDFLARHLGGFSFGVAATLGVVVFFQSGPVPTHSELRVSQQSMLSQANPDSALEKLEQSTDENTASFFNQAPGNQKDTASQGLESGFSLASATALNEPSDELDDRADAVLEVDSGESRAGFMESESSQPESDSEFAKPQIVSRQARSRAKLATPARPQSSKRKELLAKIQQSMDKPKTLSSETVAVEKIAAAQKKRASSSLGLFGSGQVRSSLELASAKAPEEKMVQQTQNVLSSFEDGFSEEVASKKETAIAEMSSSFTRNTKKSASSFSRSNVSKKQDLVLELKTQWKPGLLFEEWLQRLEKKVRGVNRIRSRQDGIPVETLFLQVPGTDAKALIQELSRHTRNTKVLAPASVQSQGLENVSWKSVREVVLRIQIELP